MTAVSSSSHRQVSVITLEEENYLRITSLLTRYATSAVRVQFDKEFYPARLQRTLIRYRS